MPRGRKKGSTLADSIKQRIAADRKARAERFERKQHIRCRSVIDDYPKTQIIREQTKSEWEKTMDKYL